MELSNLSLGDVHLNKFTRYWDSARLSLSTISEADLATPRRCRVTSPHPNPRKGLTPRSQPRCHYGHMEATPWFIGSTSTLGYGTSSDGNCWPMPRAVSMGFLGFMSALSRATDPTFLTSFITQASYCGRFFLELNLLSEPTTYNRGVWALVSTTFPWVSCYFALSLNLTPYRLGFRRGFTPVPWNNYILPYTYGNVKNNIRWYSPKKSRNEITPAHRA